MSRQQRQALKKWHYLILIDWRARQIFVGMAEQWAQKLLNKVPYYFRWEGKRKKVYTIADKTLYPNAGWDDELFKIELEQLKKN